MTRDMRSLDMAELAEVVAEQPYPLLFVTVSGAHLYGFPSVDSDVDLRGVHALPVAEVVGLRPGPETLDRTWMRSGAEIDLVTHDAAKFFRLLLRRNGYVLEQLLSPLVVTSGEVHRELVDLAPGLVTRHHAHHYRGFARGQWRLFGESNDLKPLLYTFRVLLSGIHLLRSGEVVAHLPTLAGLVPGAPGHLAELVAAKSGAEHSTVDSPTRSVLEADFVRLSAELDQAEGESTLPEAPSGAAELNDLLVRLRLAGVGGL
jgi:predicted nucleotidyltransferase